MTKDRGVWKAEDCALVLIDYQREMFEVIRSETNADMVELHARLLARTAKAFDMPVGLSTRIRHYTGLSRTVERLQQLLGEFRFDSIASIVMSAHAEAA